MLTGSKLITCLYLY